MAILSRFYIVPFLAVVVYRFRTSSFFFWPLQHWRPSQIKFSSFLQWKVVFNFNISLRIDIHRFFFRYSIGFFGWLLAAAVVFRDSIRFLGCFSQLVILRCLMRGQSICLGPCWWLIVVMPPRVVTSSSRRNARKALAEWGPFKSGWSRVRERESGEGGHS